MNSLSVLIPDFEALTGNFDILDQVKLGMESFPWEQRDSRCVWRGAMTGGVFNEENFLEFPRSRAVTFSLERPHLVDARFNVVTQCENSEVIKEKFAAYFSNSLPITDHLKFKYQLLLDGNSCAYSRFYWQLFSESLILKQQSDRIQWFYQALKPWVHYLPLDRDLKDLPQAIDWAIGHDEEAREIAKEGRAFALDNLTYPRVLQYFYLLLLEYSKLF